MKSVQYDYTLAGYGRIRSHYILVGKFKIPTNTSLTNIDLDRYARKLNIPYFKGVYMRDEIQDLKKNQNECGIMNFNTTNESGSHWVCWVKKGHDRVYFDSFAQRIPLELERYLKTKLEFQQNKLCIKRNYVVVQHINTVECGALCLYILNALMCQQLSFEKVIYQLEKRYTKNAD